MMEGQKGVALCLAFPIIQIAIFRRGVALPQNWGRLNQWLKSQTVGLSVGLPPPFQSEQFCSVTVVNAKLGSVLALRLADDHGTQLGLSLGSVSRQRRRRRGTESGRMNLRRRHGHRAAPGRGCCG
jgi:hypothetical protein